MCRHPRVGSVQARLATRTIPAPNGARLRDMSKDPAVAPQLNRAADSGIFGWTWVFMVSTRAPAAEAAAEPSSRIAIPPRDRAVSSKRGHNAFCIRRELVDGFIHSVLSSNDEVLCVSDRIGVHGNRVGQR